jgi:hypothetical protein
MFEESFRLECGLIEMVGAREALWCDILSLTYEATSAFGDDLDPEFQAHSLKLCSTSTGDQP